MTAIPQEVRDLAAGIANDIETHGHYKDDGADEYWLPEYEDNPCCIVQSPSWYDTRSDQADACIALAELLTGVDAPQLPEDVTFWNDETPTETVLATLRKIAAGEKP